MIQKVQKTVEVPQVPYSVRDMDVPVIKKQQVLTIQKTVQTSISELDECGTKATAIRQKQHAEFVTLIANSDGATELIKLAVIMSSRLHALKSHKDALKYELSQPDVDEMNRLDAMIQSMLRPKEDKVEKNIAMLMTGVEKRADLNGFMQNVEVQTRSGFNQRVTSTACSRWTPQRLSRECAPISTRRLHRPAVRIAVLKTATLHSARRQTSADRITA